MNRIEAVWAAADVWERFSLIALVIATLIQTAFVVEYATRPWWLVRIGRALMLKSAALCVLLWLSILNSFVSYSGQEQVAMVTLWLITAAIFYQWLALRTSPRQPTSASDSDRSDP